MSKLKTLAWYLRQPAGLKLTWNLFLRKTFYSSREATADASVQWCTERAINTDDFFQKYFPGAGTPEDPFRKHSEAFDYASRKVKETPYTLGGGGNTFLLYNCCNAIGADRVVETGVAYGWSSLSILLALGNRPGAKLYSTDMPYAKMGNEDFVGIVVPDKYKEQWELFREADVSGIPKILARVKSLDLIHYDSDKSYVGRMQTYPKLWGKLRPGGIFISDDIQDNVAFKDYAEKKLGISPVVISFDGKFVGVIIKPQSGG